MRRRVRTNPVINERLLETHARLREAIDVGLRELIEHRTVAKVFLPIPAKTVGPLAAEMDLLRIAVGEWKRTGKPYEACSFGMVDYLAFAYCAERVLIAAGEVEAAKIFSFVRLTKDARKTVGGYPNRGGLSRVLQWFRDHGPLGANDHQAQLVHCTPEMLAFEKPLDTLAFARSELFPMDRWADGWSAIDKKIVALRPMNSAWRGEKITGKQVLAGLLGAGQRLSAWSRKWNAEKANLELANLRGADLEGAILNGADLRGANLEGADIRYASLYSANLVGADLTRADLVSANLVSANLGGANLLSADLHGANLSGANLELANLERANFLYANFIGADLTRAILRGANLEGADIERADLTNADLTNAIGVDLTGAKR